MQKLNESPVTLDQIDSLGHLNVRYYIARMDLANRQLLEANGVSGDEHTFLRRVDTYNKFRREQFNGAVLGTYGALIGKGVIGPGGSVPAYFEIRNEETGDVAASFLTATSRVDRATQAPQDLSRRMARLDQSRLKGLSAIIIAATNTFAVRAAGDSHGDTRARITSRACSRQYDGSSREYG